MIIFWDLPYWSTNLIRHNLDVMHIEKNVFDNIINTVMDVKGKTKDNPKARLDLEEICRHPALHLIEEGNGKLKQPKSIFSLEKEDKGRLCRWIQGLKFPDGYVSNLRRSVDLKENKLTGMKSHDCHVFMERLILIALREFLPQVIWDPLTELSIFFRDLCSSKLLVDRLEKQEKDIAVTLCKLEKVFPPGFFDSVEHLPIHLSYEVRVAGPVGYRWMYPFERHLN